MGSTGAEQRHQYDLATGASGIIGTSGTQAAPLSALRDWVRGLLAAERSEVVIDVELVATELVTNAYEHTDQPIAVRIGRPDAGRVLRVEVDDGDPESRPRPGASSRGGFRGRGLKMVAGICVNWGVDTYARHKTVWAEVPVT